MAIAGKLGAIYIQSDEQTVACDLVGYDPDALGIFEFVDAETIPDATYTRYTISDPARRYWLQTYPITVEKNGVEVTSGYTVEYAGGVIVFATPLAPDDIITVSGKYLSLKQAGGCFKWALEMVGDIAEITKFASGGWRENMQLVNTFVADAEAYWWTMEMAENLGKELCLVLYINADNDIRYEGFAMLNDNGVETSVEELVKETIGFQGVGPVYFREG